LVWSPALTLPSPPGRGFSPGIFSIIRPRCDHSSGLIIYGGINLPAKLAGVFSALIMKRCIRFFLALGFLVTGCDTLNWQQYQVAGIAAGSSDAGKLEAVLQTVAGKVRLDNRTSSTRLPGTLVFYAQPPQAFRVDLGARFYQTNVLVDLVGGFGPTPPAYKRAKKLLLPALSAEFGSRVSIPQPFIPIK